MLEILSFRGHKFGQYYTVLWRASLASLVASIMVLSVTVIYGCEFIADITTEYESGPLAVYHDRQPLHLKSPSGDSARLANSETAVDPTWQELMAFLQMDGTDQKLYIADSYACVAFAEELHNNAEAAGIKAAFVGVQFEDSDIGHALNAFSTTDLGLVYVDCTSPTQGGSVFHTMQELDSEGSGDGDGVEASAADKIAYVDIGREYGVIGIEVATSPEYGFYEAYMAESTQFGIDVEAFNRDLDAYNEKVDAYNLEVDSYNRAVEAYEQEVAEYNRALGGRTELPEPEYTRFKEWAERLDDSLAMLSAFEERIDSQQSELQLILEKLQQRQEKLDATSSILGNVSWQPLGIVENIEIYW